MPLGETAALTTAVFWALTGVFFAEASRRIGALRVNMLRLPLALAPLSLGLALTGTSLGTLTAERVLLLAASALVGLVFGDLALFHALTSLGPRLSSLLMALAPLFAALTGFALLGERLGGRAWAGMIVTLSGVAWVVAEYRGGERAALRLWPGVPLAAFAAACQGVGLVLAKLGMAGEVPPLAATWVRMVAASTTIWAAALVTGRTSGLGLAASLRAAWRPVAAGTAFGPFAGVWLSLVAARLTEVGVAATIMATTPLWMIPLVMTTEGYRPSARAVTGTAVAVAGVALLFVR